MNRLEFVELVLVARIIFNHYRDNVLPSCEGTAMRHGDVENDNVGINDPVGFGD
jgi:hypothetical protein